MRRLFGQLRSVFLPGMGLSRTSFTVAGEFSFSSIRQDNIEARIPMIKSGMTRVFQDGHG